MSVEKTITFIISIWLKIKNALNIFWANEVYKSIARHVFSSGGGLLAAHGIIANSVALWLPGGGFILLGGIWGALNEYWAGSGILHFWLSIIRHSLSAFGSFCIVLGWIPLGTDVDYIAGVIISTVSAAWGIGDEKINQQETTTDVSS